ncbi:MAG: acyltransferase family protein [Rhodoglobus sp.]
MDLSARDLSLDLARVFCVLLVVVIHLLMVGVGIDAEGQFIAQDQRESPLAMQPWFDLGTWVGQIMPLFFVVGGFASITAWRSTVRRGGTAAGYVRTRVLRLAQPALPLYLFYVAVIGGATLAAVSPELLSLAVVGAASPLWFLAAYTLCQALVPAMVSLHTRAPRVTLLVLLVGAVAIDSLRYASSITEIGLINLVFVWLLVQQIGFWYADGWFAARRWWQLVLMAILAYSSLIVMTSVGPYDINMLVNLNPPTVPLVSLAIAQACVLRLLRPALTLVMGTRAARTVVFLVGSRLMTIYLWHLPVILIITGASLLIPGAAPAPGTELWWWTRPLVYVLTFVTLFGLSFLVGRWEAPRESTATPPSSVVALAAVLSFIPSFLVLQFFIDLPIAIIGSVFLAVTVIILRRWKSRKHSSTPATVV